jgi:hypothetical protein
VSPLRVRLALLQGLNRRLRRVLPLVDLSSGHEWRAGAALRRLGHAIFFDLKAELLDAALRSSATQARHISLRLDHAKKTLSQVPYSLGPVTLSPLSLLFGLVLSLLFFLLLRFLCVLELP